jgi:O-antigen ligase
VLAFGTTVIIFLMGRAPKIGMIARVAIVAVLVLVSVNYSEIVEERFQNFGNDYNFSEENGRLNIWKQNVAIISENPFLGTGAGCSTISLGLYGAQVGGNQAWYSSHSSVFQFAVDNGIPAFIVYCILNILAIVNLRRIRRYEGHPLSNIAFFVELSFYGFWVGGLLLSHAYSINLFVLFGISASLTYFYRNEPGMNRSEQITKQE